MLPMLEMAKKALKIRFPVPPLLKDPSVSTKNCSATLFSTWAFLSTTTIWKRVSKYFYLLIGLRDTYIRDVYSHIKQDGNADTGKHSDWMLASWSTDLAHDIIRLFKPRETEDDGKEGMGVPIRIARVGEGGRRLGVCSNMFFHWFTIRTFQTSSPNNNSCHNDKEKNHNLDHGQHVVQ